MGGPPLEDFAYVVNSDVRGGALLHKAPLELRPMPMYDNSLHEYLQSGMKITFIYKVLYADTCLFYHCIISSL